MSKTRKFILLSYVVVEDQDSDGKRMSWEILKKLKKNWKDTA